MDPSLAAMGFAPETVEERERRLEKKKSKTPKKTKFPFKTSTSTTDDGAGTRPPSPPSRVSIGAYRLFNRTPRKGPGIRPQISSPTPIPIPGSHRSFSKATAAAAAPKPRHAIHQEGDSFSEKGSDRFPGVITHHQDAEEILARDGEAKDLGSHYFKSSRVPKEAPVLPEISCGDFRIIFPVDGQDLTNPRGRSLRAPATAMDPSHLAPGPFEGPDKQKQIQDARDMYQVVLRNAERAGVAPPPYDFIELIGKGASGRVYKCKKHATGELVAVKIINVDDDDYQLHALDKDDAIKSFQKEIGTAQKLKDSNAQNVNLIHDAFDLHNQLWIVSEYCTGGSVRTLMRANPPPNKGLEEHFIIPIARELALAIKSVHDISVIHRDIKCTNVYINEEGNIQLGDFGVVGIIDDGSTKRRTIIGTPNYMTKEMLTPNPLGAEEGYGTEVDVWSYGCTLFEMATGLPPNATVKPEDLYRVLSNAPRLEAGDYSQELRDFVAFCLNPHPEERPSIDTVLRHPYVANSAKKYPTNSLVRLIERFRVWEYKGGQRQSLFFKGGAAAPSATNDDESTNDDDDQDWSFSTSDNFNVAFGQRLSQLIAIQDFADSVSDAPAGTELPPLVTKDLTAWERLEQQHLEMSANRGERSLGRLWNAGTAPYELHTPLQPERVSDLPFRNYAGAAATRESLIDLDSAGATDGDAPAFNFDFGDVPTMKPRTVRDSQQNMDEDEASSDGYRYDAGDTDDKRATMEWKFPTPGPVTQKRATMDWTFSNAEPTESDDPEFNMSLPPAGEDGEFPDGFRPSLKHTTTEPLGQFGDYMHRVPPSIPLSSSPVRDSIGSMIDLNMALDDTNDMRRPSTAGSAAGSTVTDMTSGNPFDLEEDPRQNELDRNRFSYHKQWQSEGGHVKRLSHKTMSMHSRGSSLTSTDSDLNYLHDDSQNEDGLDYDYDAARTAAVDPLHNPLMAGMSQRNIDHWPSFSSDSGLDDESTYPTLRVPKTAARTNSNGPTSRSISRPRDLARARPEHRELEFPTVEPPHPDALVEGAAPQTMMSEMERMLEDFDFSLQATSSAMSQHSGLHEDGDSSGQWSGFDTGATSTGDEDGF